MEDFIGTPEEYNLVRFGIKEPYCSICNCMIEQGEEWEEDFGLQFHSRCIDHCNQATGQKILPNAASRILSLWRHLSHQQIL